MRGNDRQRVTIEFGTDDSSLQRALRDIDQLRQALQGLQGRAVGASGAPSFTGSPFQPPRPPNDFGAPNTPSFGGGGFGGGWQPFGGGGSMPFGGGWAPAGGINLSGVATVTLTNVATVNITATTVNVTGNISTGGGGGGGGAIPDVGSPLADTGTGQAAQGAGGAFTRMPRMRTAIQSMLEGAGVEGFTAASLGTFGQSIMNIAPYAIPAVGYGAFGSAITAAQSQINRAGDVAMGIGIGGAQGTYSTPGQQMSHQMEMDDTDRQGWLAFGKGTFLYQGLDFLSAGSLSRWNMEIDRAKQIAPQVADIRARMQFIKYVGGQDYTNIVPSWQEAMNTYGNEHDATIATQQMMSALGTVPNASQIRLTSAGMTGLSTAVKYLNENPMIADAQLSGIMSGVNTLTPTARQRAYFGKSSKEDLAAAVMGNLFSGNWSAEAKAGALGLGVSEDYQAEYTLRLSRAQEDAMSAQMSSSMSISYSQKLLATGRGAKLASGAMMSGVDAMSEQIDALRSQASLAPNELEKKKIKTQIASLEAQIATTRKSAYYMPFAQDLAVASAGFSQAGAETQLYSYSGNSVYGNPGYEAGATAARQTYDTLMALKSSPWWSTANPDEKAQVEAQIAQANLQIKGQYRAQSFAMYGETQSGIGLTRAGLSGQATFASMTSTPQGAFQAQTNLLQSNESLIRAERELLERGNLSLTERNQHLATITQLQNEIKIGTEQNLRTLYGGEMGLSQTIGGGYGARSGRETILGGSLAGFGSQANALGEVRKQITMAEKELQRRQTLGQSGQSIAEVQTQIEQLKTQETIMLGSMMDYQADPKTERAGIMNSMYLSTVTRTFAGYGDVRRGLYQGMEIVGHKLQQLEALKNKDLAEAKTPEQREMILTRYAQQAAPLFNEAIGFQQSLESGWQERLYSEVIGGGGNYDIAAARFTHRESAMFGGITNRFFGGNARTMDHFRRQAPMWYQSFAGSLGRPQGFMDTASEMMDSGGKIELGGVVHLDITLRDSTGHKLTNTQEQINVNNQALDASFKKHKGQMP